MDVYRLCCAVMGSDQTLPRARGGITARAMTVAVAAITALGLAGPGASSATGPARSGAHASARGHAHTVLQSRLLWATVNACSPPDHHNTVGVRGSMPGDGQANEQMYMRFRVQYRRYGRWINVPRSISGWVAVGGAHILARQSGRSFRLTPTTGSAFLLRGNVEFQWRRGSRIVRRAVAHTTAGHRSTAGADPRGYSAATCHIG